MRRFFLTCALVLGWAALVAARPARGQGLRVPLGADPGTELRFGGAERVRGESWTGFGATALDDRFGLSRLDLRADLRLRGRFTAVADVHSGVASDRTLPGGRRLVDEDQLDVQQLYGQLALPLAGATWTARAGRFEMGFGAGRLVSPADWLNVRRAFQGASLAWARGRVELRGFYTRPIAVRRYTPNLADSTRLLYGIVVSRASSRARLEAYWLRAEIAGLGLNGTTGYARLHTLGARAFRAPSAGRLDFDLEAAWQAGTVGAEAQRAWMLGTVVGRTIGGPALLRLYAGLDAASGDRAAGGSVRTFDQLYPTGHTFLGYADVQGRQNVVAPTVGASLTILGLGVQVDAFDFSRASTHDGVYAADGSLLRPAAGTASHVGDEVDLTLRRALAGGRLALQGGVSRYMVGAFLKASAVPARDVTFLYAQAAVAY